MLRYHVVVWVPDHAEGGNLAVRPDVMVQTAEPGEGNGWLGGHASAFEVMGMGAMALRVPVFTKGEVLILDDDGREVDGERRKPGKWNVRTEEFVTVEAAVARATEVLDADVA